MLKPTRGYVLVEQLDDELKTASGIALPESTKDKPQKGIVVEVGEDSYESEIYPSGVPTKVIRSRKSDFNLGDKVVFKRWSTTDLEEDGKKLAFVKFEDILGRYE